MDDDVRIRGQRLALILGGLAVFAGIIAVVVNALQGDEFRVGLLVPIAAGLVVIATVRRRTP